MSGVLSRLMQMMLGWGTVGIIYNLCDFLQGEGYRLTPMWIDEIIPFSATAVWLYLSFFLIVPLGYLLVPASRLRWLTRATQLAGAGSGIVYLLWPTTMLYPTVTGEGISVRLLEWLIAVDSSQNCFPSLHAGLTLLAVWAIAAGHRKWITIASIIWALAITFSILQLRRHLFIDLAGGALLAWGCGWLVTRLEMRKEQHREITHE